MKKLDKHIENNKIEKSNYQIRVEIAEKCLSENITLPIIAKVCSFTEQEVIIIFRSLKRRESMSERKIRLRKKEEINVDKKVDKLDKEKQIVLKNELKRIEKENLIQYQKNRQKEADLQRKIATENTRLLIQKLKKEEESNIEKEQQEEILKIKKREKLQKKNKRSEILNKINDLDEEQKIKASVGNCYLKGLSVKQAVLFSKVPKEKVEQIYNSFKKK